MKTIKRHTQKGVVAIETALGLLAFLMMIFYWMEVSYMGFVSSLMDYASAEGSRAARTSELEEGDYQKLFEDIIKDSGSIWGQFVDADDIKVSTYFCESVEQAASLDCNEDGSNYPIAVYQLTYYYQPLLTSLFFKPGETMAISREAFAIQEYETGGSNG